MEEVGCVHHVAQFLYPHHKLWAYEKHNVCILMYVFWDILCMYMYKHQNCICQDFTSDIFFTLKKCKELSHTVSLSTKCTLIDSYSTFVTSVASLAITEKSMPGERCEGSCYDVTRNCYHLSFNCLALCTVHSLSCFQMLLKHFSSPDSVRSCSKAEKLPWLAVGSLCIEAAWLQWPLKAIACLPPKIMVFAVGCSFQQFPMTCSCLCVINQCSIFSSYFYSSNK